MSSNSPIIQLSDFIEDAYGSPEALAQRLDLTVDMLFYVEEDTFSRIELQEVATALRKIAYVLRKEKETD
jgi:hypothetical protein